MKHVKKFLSLFVCLLLVISMVACGNSETGGGNNTDTNNGGSKVLNVATSMDDGTLSPALVGTEIFAFLSTVQESLWDVTRSNEIIYQLCESVEIVSDTQQILHLREGVKFSNGNLFTAEDVLFSFNIYNESGFTGQPRVQTVDIPACSAIDEYTVDLRLIAPSIANWTVLSQCLIYDKESYTADGAAIRPIGTGPYVVTDYVAGSSLSLERNENYWGEEPEFDQINVKILAEDSQRVNALETELVDMASIATTDYDYVTSLDNVGVVGNYTGQYVTTKFNFGKSSVFANNVDARRAVAHALNSEAILNAVYMGRGKIMHAAVPDYMFDFEDRFNDLDDTFRIGYNPELAKELAESSGLTEKRLRFITNGSGTSIKMAEMAQGMLNEIGVQVDIYNYDSGTVSMMMFSEDGDWDLLISEGISPNLRVGDELLNGVRYRPDMIVPGAFDGNEEYLEKAPLCMSLQDEQELSDMLYEMLGHYEREVLSFALFDVEHYIGHNTRIDPESIRLSAASEMPRYQDIKLAS